MEHHNHRTPVTPIIVHQAGLRKERLSQLGRTHHPDTLALTAKKSRDPHGGDVNTDLSSTVKRNYSDAMEIERNSEDSAEDFSSLLNTKSPQKKLTPIIELVTNKNRIERVWECLVRSVTVVCGTRFRAVEFAEALKVYRFDKKRAVFGESTDKLEKSNDYAFRTMADIYTGFKLDDKNSFYVLYNRNCMYFTRKDAQKKPILLLYNENEYLRRSLSESNISFCNYQDSVDPQMVIITDMNISRFWNKFMNQVLSKDLALEIVSNFKFLGCYESLPRVTFNGIETNKKYDYMREEKTTKLQKVLELEPKPSVFNVRMDGYFMRHNLLALNSALQQKGMKFELSMDPVKQTEKFKEMMEKKQ